MIDRRCWSSLELERHANASLSIFFLSSVELQLGYGILSIGEAARYIFELVVVCVEHRRDCECGDFLIISC